jgi:hypothetical protein
MAKVLIACEESQTVCKAFRERGHEAFSCDIQECSGGHPEWHILGDCLPVLNGRCSFITQDGRSWLINTPWDLIIAHPPCTYLTGAGAANIPKHPERIAHGYEAKYFFLEILNAECRKICVENPPPMKRFNLPRYTQIVRPWEHGHNNNKAVCLWLKGLPALRPSNIIPYEPDNCYWTYKKTGEKKCCSKWYNRDTANYSKSRSKTFPGIAKAMAEQWGDILK